MTKLEFLINGDKLKSKTICTCINNLESGEMETAWINANNISEVVQKLPKGYEIDLLATLGNYFNNDTIETYDLAIENSQYIYHVDFDTLCDVGFRLYIESIKNDNSALQNRLDGRFQN